MGIALFSIQELGHPKKTPDIMVAVCGNNVVSNSLDEVEISRLLGKESEQIQFDYFDNEQPIDRQKYVTRLVSGEYNFLIIDQEEYNQLSAKEQLAKVTTTCFLMSLKEENVRNLVYGIPLKEELIRNSSNSLKQLIVSQLNQN